MWRLVLTGLAALLTGAILLPGLFIGPSLDASIFSTVGWRLAEGDALYAEVWDHKPPGAYLPSLGAHLLSEDPAVAWGLTWVVTLLCIVGAAMVVGRLLARRGAHAGARVVATALVVLGAGSYLVSLGGGMSESFAILPLALSIRAASSRYWLFSGLAAGTAIAFSLQSLPILAAIAVLGLLGDRRDGLRHALAVAAGTLVVGMTVIFGLWVNGGLAEAGDALLSYSAAYRAVTAREGGASAWSVVPWTVLVMLPLLIGSGVALIQRRRLADARLAIASGAWILAGLALILLQGRFYAHYATPLVIPMATLTGLGIDAMWRNRPGRLTLAAIGLPLLSAMALSLAVGAAGARDEQAPIRASNARAATAALEIRALTDEGDAIFVWGNDARAYELSGRAPASRYVYLYPLLTPGYATDDRIAEVAGMLEVSRPAAIIDTGSLEPGAPGLPPLLIDRPLATDGRDLDLLDPIRALVGGQYRMSVASRGWPIYLVER